MKKKIKSTPKKIKEKAPPKINTEKVSALLAPFIFLFILILYSYLCFIPVIHNFHEASIASKVFMIIGSVAFVCLFALLIWGIEKVNKDTTKDKLFRICSYVFVSIVFVIALLHYFNDTLWGYNYTVWGFVFASFLLVGFYSIVRDYFGKKFNSEFKPMLLVGLGILALFIALANYDANIPVAIIYLKIAIGFGYLIAVALYVYYTFYNKKPNRISISSIISAVFWAAIILISFPFYVQWCGLKDCDFQTFVSVYSAVIGGGLTLVGVAWTIQYNKNQRKDEERQKAQPLFSYVYKKTDPEKRIILSADKFKNIESILYDSSKSQEGVLIYGFMIENSSKVEFFLCGIFINGVLYETKAKELVRKDYAVGFNNLDLSLNTVDEIKLYVEDVLGNLYTMQLDFSDDNGNITIRGNKSIQYLEKTNE